jgi:hypothetical protein
LYFIGRKGDLNITYVQGWERERFKAEAFENEKQKKWCSQGNGLSCGMLPRKCKPFLAKVTGEMKS